MSRAIAAMAVLPGLLACQSPFLLFSGGALRGPVAYADSFAFAGQYRTLELEVSGESPYSVILRVVIRGEHLYIDAAQRRRWHTLLKQNQMVRVKLGGSVYPARAVQIEDPDLIRQFLPGRTIYRLLPLPVESSFRERAKAHTEPMVSANTSPIMSGKLLSPA